MVCTRVIPSSLQALITISSAAEPAGAAMYSAPLYIQTKEESREVAGQQTAEIHACTDKKRQLVIQCMFVHFTRLARSMLSLKGKNASELMATACRVLIQFFFSVRDRGSGTSSYLDFQTAKSGPCKHKI